MVKNKKDLAPYIKANRITNSFLAELFCIPHYQSRYYIERSKTVRYLECFAKHFFLL